MPYQHLINKGYKPAQARAIMAKEGEKKAKPKPKKTPRRGFAALG